MRGGRWAWLLLLTGCRFGFAELPAVDGTTDTALELGDAIDRCAADHVQLGMWGTPVKLDVLNMAGAADEDATITHDGLELFFVSDRTGNGEIYRSTRMAPGDPWGVPAIVTELTDPAEESTPDLSEDALTMWFSSLRAPTLGMDDIWVTTRPDRQSAWTAPQHVVELSSSGLDRGSSVFDQDLSFAFHSNRPGSLNGGNDIYVATRASVTDTWSAPVHIDAPNTNQTEQHPWVSPCGLVMTFHSNRPGNVDLYQVTRASESDPWGLATQITELDMPSVDKDLRTTPDRRYGVFSSDRNGGFEIYEVSR